MSQRTYRAGVVGLGGVAVGRSHMGTPPPPFGREVMNRHVHTLSRLPNVELAAVCDIMPQAIERYKGLWDEDLPDVRTYTDLGEMLAKEDLDIVGVTTGDHTHASPTVQAANAGVKGIFVEKPLATSLEDADAMIEACEANGVAFSVDHTRRYRPLVHAVRQAIRDGAIGEPGAAVLNNFGHPATLFRNGTHFIDVLCFVVESDPVKVSAVLDEGFDHWDVYRGDGGRTPNNEPGAMGMVIFSNGLRASYASTVHSSFHMVKMLVNGTEGYLEFDLNGDSFTVTTNGVGSEYGVGVRTVAPDSYQIIGIPAGYLELIDMIENGAPSISSAREARKTVQIMMGFLQSYQQGSRLIDVPA